MQRHIVRFEPWGTVVECAAGQTLLDAARLADIPIGAVCGGNGTCGKCQVRILSGPLASPSPVERDVLGAEALTQGYRLACRYPIRGDLEIEILPVVSHGKDALPALERAAAFGPAIGQRAVTLEPPDLARPVDDGSNLLAATGAHVLDYRVAQLAPDVLRAGGWRVTAGVRAAEIISLRPATDASAPSLGLAIDLGTTNIAAYFYNLEDGAPLGVFAAANPLASYGADILTRLIYAQQNQENGQRLQHVLVRALNLLITRATATLGYAPGDVEDAVIVGNTGMHHLLLVLPARHLVVSPYVAATRRAVDIKAREIGLAFAPGAYLHLPPLVGGFVGSDLLAVALATRLDLKPGVRLAIDIGTNTELLLSVDGKLVSCSTASGPALEGAALRYGMLAGAGAVDRVWLEDDGAFRHTTIRGKPASGMCGSGIISALACMAEAGVINRGGRIQAGQPGVIELDDGDRGFVLVPEAATALGDHLTISQHDVRAIQLAKGAIRGGIATLLAENGLTVDDLDEFLVAGAFGNHLEVESAVAIGLYPDIPRDRIRLIGNAAGAGAAMALLSMEERRAANELSQQIEYIELARIRRFARQFAEAQRFPEAGVKP